MLTNLHYIFKLILSIS